MKAVEQGVEKMGKTLVSIKVENNFDIEKVAEGTKTEIRSIETEAMVDTGATTVCLPRNMVKEMGLRKIGTRRVKTAKGKDEVGVYGPVQLTIQGRECRVDVFELSDSIQPLVGYLPLEWLDFHIDPKNGKLIPNPEHGDELILDLL